MAFQLKRRMTKEYQNELELEQLKDHILSGAPNHFYIYSSGKSLGVFDDIEKAVAVYNRIHEKGLSHLVLATRIGTSCTLLSKEIK